MKYKNATNPKRGIPHTLYAIRHTREAGFTLIELLAVCAIMAVIAGVVLANQGKFGGQVLLQNFAYDVALSIRQAQVYGISVQRFGSSASGFSQAYGVHFDDTTGAYATAFELFADTNGNSSYDSTHGCPQQQGPASEFVSCSSITRGYAITKLCVPADLSNPSDPTSCTGVTKLDIMFVRPEPDALISWTDSGSLFHACLPQRIDCGASARIVLQSPRGDKMSIEVFNNGQIAVDQVVTN